MHVFRLGFYGLRTAPCRMWSDTNFENIKKNSTIYNLQACVVLLSNLQVLSGPNVTLSTCLYSLALAATKPLKFILQAFEFNFTHLMEILFLLQQCQQLRYTVVVLTLTYQLFHKEYHRRCSTLFTLLLKRDYTYRKHRWRQWDQFLVVRIMLCGGGSKMHLNSSVT